MESVSIAYATESGTSRRAFWGRKVCSFRMGLEGGLQASVFAAIGGHDCVQQRCWSAVITSECMVSARGHDTWCFNRVYALELRKTCPGER